MLVLLQEHLFLTLSHAFILLLQISGFVLLGTYFMFINMYVCLSAGIYMCMQVPIETKGDPLKLEL